MIPPGSCCYCCCCWCCFLLLPRASPPLPSHPPTHPHTRGGAGTRGPGLRAVSRTCSDGASSTLYGTLATLRLGFRGCINNLQSNPTVWKAVEKVRIVQEGWLWGDSMQSTSHDAQRMGTKSSFSPKDCNHVDHAEAVQEFAMEAGSATTSTLRQQGGGRPLARHTITTATERTFHWRAQEGTGSSP